MKPIMQKYKHISKIQKGDCWRACLASILECSIDLFPDPNVVLCWPTLYSLTLVTLEKMGYNYTSYTVAGITEEVINNAECNGYIIAIGKSPRSNHCRVTHAVVWRNGIKHDPHPDGTGLLDITRFEILTKI